MGLQILECGAIGLVGQIAADQAGQARYRSQTRTQRRKFTRRRRTGGAACSIRLDSCEALRAGQPPQVELMLAGRGAECHSRPGGFEKLVATDSMLAAKDSFGLRC